MWISNQTSKGKICQHSAKMYIPYSRPCIFCFLFDSLCYNKEIMETEILKKIEEQQALINQIYRSVEKTRKYFQWTMIITVALFVLPLIGLLFAVPAFLSSFSQIQTFGL